MRFLSPLALLGLALIALPVAIHLLVRRRAARLDFPSLRFLRETPSFRLRPRRIQQPLLLALRVAAIALLVMGFARPLSSLNTRDARTHVILLDASLSMQATGRAEACREQARGILNNLAAGERAAVIAFSNDTLLLSATTPDKRFLNTAIDRYQPSSGAADYAAAFTAAEDLLRNEPHGEALIDLVSDFQSSGLRSESLPRSDKNAINSFSQIIAHPVGEQLERNAFLSDEAIASSEAGEEISASEIIAVAGERSGARKSFALDSSNGSRADIEWQTESNGQLTARLRTLAPDEFDADDERFLSFAVPRKARALLIERDGDDALPYLRAALETAASNLGEKHFALERKQELQSSASGLESYSLIALMLRAKPRVDELRVLEDYARAGGTVWLCAGRDVDTAAWNEFASGDAGRAYPFTGLVRKNDAYQALSFGATDADAPALSFAGAQVLTALSTVRMHEGYAVTPRVDAATIMRWNDGTPAFVSKESGGGKILLFGASPARATGELGVSAAFPALVSSIARSSVTPREPLSREIGEPVELKLAPDAVVKITSAEGKTETARARDLLVQPVAYFARPGIYRVESNAFTRYLAFNAPEAESEAALTSAGEIERLFKPQERGANETRPSTGRESVEQKSNAWRYFLYAAFLLLIVEMFVAMRQGRNIDKDGQAEQAAKI
jgi:hypothetical protein